MQSPRRASQPLIAVKRMIETSRLVLRPFKESDLDDLYEYLREITIHCFMDMKTKTREEAAEILDVLLVSGAEKKLAILN